MFCVAVARPVFCHSKPRPRKAVRHILTPRDVRREIDHAKLICYNFEDTPECRVAWDQVEEISGTLARQMETHIINEMCIEDPDSCKEFDV